MLGRRVHALFLCAPDCRYTNIYVGRPSLDEDYVQTELTPNQCRLRDQTYSAPVSVDVEYTRGKDVVIRKGKNGAGAILIGRMPIMLRSDRCRRVDCCGNCQALLAAGLPLVAAFLAAALAGMGLAS